MEVPPEVEDDGSDCGDGCFGAKNLHLPVIIRVLSWHCSSCLPKTGKPTPLHTTLQLVHVFRISKTVPQDAFYLCNKVSSKMSLPAHRRQTT